MLVREISWDEVIHAGTVIFGVSFAAAADAGGWRSDLKTAYRRRVLETHPDRAAVLGRSEAELLAEFRAVSEAYELLAQLRAGPLPARPFRPAPPAAARAWTPPAAPRAAPPPPPPAARRAAAPPPGARRPGPQPGAASPPPPAAPRAASSAASTSARAPGAGPGPAPRAAAADAGAPRARVVPPWPGAALPRRKLKLAEFLYYSGRVSWQDFVAAIAWQRAQRPAVGRIAVGFGFLDRWEVAEILEKRRAETSREPFGEYAVRHRYLTPFQLLAMLGQQLRLQRPIGQFFVAKGLVDDADLDRARAVIFRHNARYPG